MDFSDISSEISGALAGQPPPTPATTGPYSDISSEIDSALTPGPNGVPRITIRPQTGTAPVDSGLPSGPSWLPRAIGDIPKEIANAAGEAYSTANAGLNPLSQDYQAKSAHENPNSDLSSPLK